MNACEALLFNVSLPKHTTRAKLKNDFYGEYLLPARGRVKEKDTRGARAKGTSLLALASVRFSVFIPCYLFSPIPPSHVPKKVISQNLNPYWNEDFLFNIPSQYWPLIGQKHNKQDVRMTKGVRDCVMMIV